MRSEEGGGSVLHTARSSTKAAPVMCQSSEPMLTHVWGEVKQLRGHFCECGKAFHPSGRRLLSTVSVL